MASAGSTSGCAWASPALTCRQGCLPEPELQAGVRLSCSMVEDHVGADHKGVLKDQGVGHTLHATVDGLLAGLALAQALKAKQRERLMETAQPRLQQFHDSCCRFLCSDPDD